MEKSKLYTASWSLHCSKAERLLNEANLYYEKIDLGNEDLLAAASRDIGLHLLPTLKINGKAYEGLKEIEAFLIEINGTI